MTKETMFCTASEIKKAEKWCLGNIYANSISPISFIYDGIKSAELFSSLKTERFSEELDENKIKYVKQFTETTENLVIRIEAILYKNFPVVEWTAYVKNEGKNASRIIKDILALDADFIQPEKSEFVLHYQKGSHCDRNDFECYDAPLYRNETKTFSPIGGRSCNEAFPYYCVQSENCGFNIAIGWLGQWYCSFERDGENLLKIRAGQERTNLKLLPREEIRTPRIVLQFWDQDISPEFNEMRSKNIFRQWMREYNMPKVNGEAPRQNFAACSSHQFAEMINANEENQKEFIDRYAEENLGINYWWMDAGWYPCENLWTNTGTWKPDTARFPNGLRPISDHGRSKGMGTILWFEPERIAPNTELYDEHPEWMLIPPENPGGMDYNASHRLFNFGIPEARDWMIERVDSIIVSEGIDFYRQDFNQDPLLFWRNNEQSDRQGANENHYITGLLGFWDALRQLHPNMLIDSCASGGRRNDIDVMKRAVPLIRSDLLFHPVEQQAHFMGASNWLPFHGTGTIFGKSALGDFACIGKLDGLSTYDFRSHMSPHITAGWDVRDRTIDYDMLRKLIKQWRQIVCYYSGDFYPLTRYSLDNSIWAAWQFNRPDLDEGVLQAFRRAESNYTQAVFALKGLIPEAVYEITNIDSGDIKTISGNDLMEKGLAVTLSQEKDTAVIVYKIKA